MGNLAKIEPQSQQSVTLWREPSLPDKLNALVEQRQSISDMPVIGPVSAGHLRAYVEQCVPPMPAIDQIETMMAKLSLALSKAGMSNEEADERLSIYCQALKDIALPDLQRSFKILLRTCRFFPTVAEIEAAVAPIRAQRTRRVVAARLLILKHDREWRSAAEPMTPSEMQELRQALADALAQHTNQQ